MKAGRPCCSWPTAPGNHCAQLGRLAFTRKPITVAGSSSSDEAKIGGMTPEVLIFRGRNEVSPPNIRLPTCRFGYCTSSRRCERSMKTIAAVTAMIKTSISSRAPGFIPPVRASE